jgi:hypothetical protein
MKQAYKAAPIDDPDVIAAMKIPAFQEAHAIGRRIAKLEGVDLPPLTKEMVKVDGKSLSEQIPQSVQAIDYMKRGLDDLIEGKMRSGTMARTEARLLRQKLNGVLEKVDAAVPEYAKARAQFAGDSRLMEAHDAGREFMKAKPDEIEELWAGMSDGEKDLYRRGTLSELSTQARQRDRRSRRDADVPESAHARKAVAHPARPADREWVREAARRRDADP